PVAQVVQHRSRGVYLEGLCALDWRACVVPCRIHGLRFRRVRRGDRQVACQEAAFLSMSRAWHPSGQHGDVMHGPEDDCVNCGSCRPSRWNTSPLIIPSAPAKATRAAKPSGLSAMSRPAGRRRDADVLVDNGLDVLVLEARNRVGGRIETVASPETRMPIEIGAEFLHGAATATRELAERYGLRTIDVSGQRFEHTTSGLRVARDYTARLDRVLGRLDAHRSRDRSLAEAMRANRGSLSAADRSLATRFVEGFDAADATLVSERWLATAGWPGRDRRESRVGRLLDGYGALVHALARPLGARVRLGTVATAIRWRPGGAEVVCASGRARGASYAARAVLATLPLGVMQAAP